LWSMEKILKQFTRCDRPD